jgi:hypothetical protein
MNTCFPRMVDLRRAEGIRTTLAFCMPCSSEGWRYVAWHRSVWRLPASIAADGGPVSLAGAHCWLPCSAPRRLAAFPLFQGRNKLPSRLPTAWEERNGRWDRVGIDPLTQGGLGRDGRADGQPGDQAIFWRPCNDCRPIAPPGRMPTVLGSPGHHAGIGAS